MNMGYIMAKHYNAHMLSYIPHMKSSCKIFLLAVLVILSVSASDEIPGYIFEHGRVICEGDAVGRIGRI